MREFSRTLVQVLGRRGQAPEQGGLLSGKDPSAFNTTDPLRLWIIQVGVIIGATQLLALGLRKIRQPKVIAEVIGGIILGPTAFGHIPGFTNHVFPQASRPFMSLVANIGLILFLFLVGLEIDAAIIKRHARLSATIALAGMTLPFGVGIGLSVPIYHRFVDPSIVFTHFMLFTGVAFSITAFPVLCRILTELKLLDTTVGIVVLSAGVANDILGWTLLALSVALVNAGTRLSALWILLVCVAWTLILLFPVKIALLWLARRTGSVENGPTMFFMTITILLVFGSAFFTDIIGVHAIFGAFVVGIIVPRDGGLAIALTEKLEDMVSIIFLPLYFTLTGLSTNLGLLNDGITWAYTAAICTVAFGGKFGGCTLAARYIGFSWREASTIGSLMSCKGLVELIVLNVGLSAGILSQRVFSMFVLEALLLTFMTTPLVSALYPPEKRRRVTASGADFKNIADGEQNPRSSFRGEGREYFRFKTRSTVVLDKIDHLPSMMALTQLVHGAPPSSPHYNPVQSPQYSGSSVDILRLIELSDRTSAVMKSSVADTLLSTDPLLSIFRMFGELHGLAVSTSLTIVPYHDLAHTIAEHAQKMASEFILIPWLPHFSSRTEPNIHDPPTSPKVSQTNNPFDALLRSTHGIKDKSTSALHSQFVRSVFSQAQTDVALFVDQGHVPGAITAQHLFLPFFGGPDDRLCLEFVAQLCSNPNISATVVKIVKMDAENEVMRDALPVHLGPARNSDSNPGNPDYQLTVNSATGFADTEYGQANTQTRMQSEAADNISWDRFTSNAPTYRSEAPNSQGTALSRIQYSVIQAVGPLRAALERVVSLVERRPRVLVVVGRSRRLAVEDHHRELKQLMEEHGHVRNEVKKTLGDVATAFLVAGRGAGIIVLQAASLSPE